MAVTRGLSGKGRPGAALNKKERKDGGRYPFRKGVLATAVARACVRIVWSLLGLLVFVVSTSSSPAGPAPAAPPRTGELSPLDCDILAYYQLPTNTLWVSWTARFSVSAPASAVTLGLPAALTVTDFTLDGARQSLRAGGGQSDYALYEAEGPISAGVPHTVHFDYHGRPEQYDQHEDRYWTATLPTCVWVDKPEAWMPMFCYPGVVRWECLGFRLSVMVPSGWTVFSPGAAAAAKLPVDAAGLLGPDFPPLGDLGRLAVWSFESAPGSLAAACVWVAGPYVPVGEGEAGGVRFEIWGLPGFLDRISYAVNETPDILRFLEETLGPPARSRELIVELPPQQGGGEAWNGLVGIAAGEPRYGNLRPEQLLVHELAHDFGGFSDEGVCSFLGLWYLQRYHPESFAAAVSLGRDYVLSAVRRYGDLSIQGAMTTAAAGATLPDRHAFLYVKPALTWLMFEDSFGDQAVSSFARKLRQASPQGWEAGPDPGTVVKLYRDILGEVAGEQGRRFCRRFVEETGSCELAVVNARCVAGGGAAGKEDWVLLFDIVDTEARDPVGLSACLPTVKVRVVTEETPGSGAPGGKETGSEYRVGLEAATTRVRLVLEARPVEVVLDPDRVLLDPDVSDNTARVELVPRNPWGGLAEALAPLVSAVALAALLRWGWSRVPTRTKGPPPFLRRERSG